eukprot:251315_1
MGRRKKKKSIRCKTSKKEYKHKNKNLKSSPAVHQYQIPLNQIIDSNGKSSKLIHSQLLKQNKMKTPTKKSTLSPAVKVKIDNFLFGTPSNHREHQKDDDSKDDDTSMNLDDNDSTKSIASNTDNTQSNEDNDSKCDILKISNLDIKVNEKIIAKIVNKKLSSQTNTKPSQISLKCISILCTGSTKIAKIKVTNLKNPTLNRLYAQIIDLLNGKKLFGKVLKCAIIK